MALMSTDCISYESDIHNKPIINGKTDITDNPSTHSMNCEKNRLRTFKNWPVEAPVPRERLAKAGFFYKGHDHSVQCFSCGLPVDEWSYSEGAMEKHKKLNPACDFVNNKSDNIPYITSSLWTAPTKPAYLTRGPSSETSTVYENSFDRLLGRNEENFPLQAKEHQKFSPNYKTSPPENIPNGFRPNFGNVPQTSNSFLGTSNVRKTEMPSLYQEIKATTSAQPQYSAKGIFMNGHSGMGATVTYQENNQPTENANRSSSESVSNELVNGVREAPPKNQSNVVHQGGFDEVIHHVGLPVPVMPEYRPTISNSISENSDVDPGRVCSFYSPSQPHAYPMFSGNVRLEDRMRYEEERLKTFDLKWPMALLNPRDMAMAGFYYLQVADKCKCAFCQGVLMNWTETDNPMAEHHRNFPLCPFVVGLDVGNVPSSVAVRYNGASGGQDECGLRNYETFYSHPERNKKVLPVETGSITHKGPIHATQATIDARMRSFLTWPSWSTMRPQHLAEAGFFYIGIRDHTKCFYCDVGLCNWEPGDDAWVEHGRWSKNCAYVILLKGQGFIQSCQVEAPLPTMVSQLLTSPLTEREAPSPYSSAVDEAMKSSLVQSVLKAQVYPSVLIRKALLRKFENTGRGVGNVNELSEAVMVEMEEESSQTRARSLLPSQEMQMQATNTVVNNSSTKQASQGNLSESVVVEMLPKKQEIEWTAEEELRQIKENRLCKICLDREIEVVYFPCGHLVACRVCALALKDCAVCRKPVNSILRAFLP